VLPLNRPVIAAFGIFAFLGAWNQYLWPLIVTQTNSVRTVQIENSKDVLQQGRTGSIAAV